LEGFEKPQGSAIRRLLESLKGTVTGWCRRP